MNLNLFFSFCSDLNADFSWTSSSFQALLGSNAVTQIIFFPYCAALNGWLHVFSNPGFKTWEWTSILYWTDISTGGSEVSYGLSIWIYIQQHMNLAQIPVLTATSTLSGFICINTNRRGSMKHPAWLFMLPIILSRMNIKCFLSFGICFGLVCIEINYYYRENNGILSNLGELSNDI